MWEQQNEALHDSDTNRELIREKDINDQIWHIYVWGPGQLTCTDIGLMRDTLEQQLQLPSETKQQWLGSITTAVHQRTLHKHGMMLAEQRLMETWVIRNPTCQAPVPISHQWQSFGSNR